MVIFPIDCFISRVTKPDFLQVSRAEHMSCSYCDPWLMDGKGLQAQLEGLGFFIFTLTTERGGSWKQLLVPDRGSLQNNGNKLF